MAELKQYPYTPVLGWSASRYDTFSICKRRYFYQYYAKYDADVPRARIDRFKNLTSVPLTTGSVVHTVIETLLSRLRKSTEDINRPQFVDFLRRETRHQVMKGVFEEVVYRTMPAVEHADVARTVESCLDTLIGSERYRWLIDEAVKTAADWVIEPPGYGESRIDDLKVYCKVDFLFPVGEDLHIMDWKTGKPDREKHRKQLLGYATWASHQFDVDAVRVKPTIAYLRALYEEVQETFNAYDLENFSNQVRAETAEMHVYCSDVESNIPRDKDEFPKIDNKAVCVRCPFRGLCYPQEYRYVFPNDASESRAGSW